MVLFYKTKPPGFPGGSAFNAEIQDPPLIPLLKKPLTGYWGSGILFMKSDKSVAGGPSVSHRMVAKNLEVRLLGTLFFFLGQIRPIQANPDLKHIKPFQVRRLVFSEDPPSEHVHCLQPGAFVGIYMDNIQRHKRIDE